MHRFGWWVAASTLLACVAAWLLGQWAWRVTPPTAPMQVAHIARQWLWFLWPSWLLALWALWRWRRFLTRRHVAIPLSVLITALVANLAMGGLDRALMLGLPGVAVLAAFALPTLNRSTSSAIDWFSVFFFTLMALAVWFVYIAIQTGVPAKTAASVLKLAPGFKPHFAWLPLDRRDRGHHRLAVAGALAHRTTSRRAVAQPGAAGRRRGAGVEPGDDVVAAAAGLRPQLPRARGAAVQAHPTRRVHQRARLCRVH